MLAALECRRAGDNSFRRRGFGRRRSAQPDVNNDVTTARLPNYHGRACRAKSRNSRSRFSAFAGGWRSCRRSPTTDLIEKRSRSCKNGWNGRRRRSMRTSRPGRRRSSPGIPAGPTRSTISRR